METEEPIQNQPDTKPAQTSTEKKLPPVGELLGSAWDLYKERLFTFWGIMLAPAVLTLILSALLPQVKESGLGSALGILGAVLMAVVQVGATVAILYAIIDERLLSVREAYERGLKLFLPYLWVAVLVGIITVAGFFLLIVPGIIFAIWFSFAFFVLIYEDKRGFNALVASREYVKGYWWAVFGRLLFSMFIGLVVVAALGILILVFAFVEGFGPIFADVSTAFLPLLLTPLLLSYAFFLFKSLQSIKREA